MKKRRVAILNTLAFAFLIFASSIFRNKGNMFDNETVKPLFMPAGYAFSIWGLIYFLLALWVLKSWFCSGEVCDMYERVMKFFVPCLILTGITVLVPTQISPIFIVAALITAYVSYDLVDKSKVAKSYKTPLTLLVAWLFVASIVDIVLVLKMMGVLSSFKINEVTLAIVLLGLGALVAIVFSFMKKDNVFSLVVIWAYIAIAINNKGIKGIVIMALGMCGVLVLASFFNGLKIRIKKL